MQISHRLAFHSALLVALGSVVSACQSPPEPGSVADWVSKLDKKDTRSDALKELGKLGPAAKKAIPKILPWLKEDGDWQPSAAYALGKIGDPSAVPALKAEVDFDVGAERDASTRLRNRLNRSVARALAQIGATDSTDVLIKLSQATEPKTRRSVARALGLLGDETGAAALTALAEQDSDPGVRSAAVRALGTLGSEIAVPVLVRMLYRIPEDGVGHYQEARFALIQQGSAAVSALKQALTRKNPDVEDMTVNGEPMPLGIIEAKAGSVLGAIRATGAESVMVDAHKKLYALWQTKKSEPESESLLGAVVELTYALGDLGTDGAAKAVTAVVSNTDPRVRLAATEALTTLGATSAVPALISAAKSGELEAQRAALIAASQLGGGDDLTSFDALGEGELEPIVAAERVRLLAAKECTSNAVCWEKKLKSDDPRVSARAAYELGRIEAKTAAPALLEAAEHESPQVRMGAVLSLEALDAVDVKRFESILKDSTKRVEYQPVNQQMTRIIALASHTGGS